ncbi:hypothetical protein [Aliidiomarina sanyensis]|uniref:Uncharacterized protein n=1 Tax=Aliidiomarina sanyensis TaxID=1249555 RepID=A0A432WDM2_9GAMM|nr:hypothetical protein [Aliidiomarina sanyensis]RUO30507.1 hypothetical protein CWE11_09040 [Aliidiomarina sanyensis]
MLLSFAHLQRVQRMESTLSTVALEVAGIKEVVHYFLMHNPLPAEGIDLAMLMDQGLYLGPLLNPWDRPYVFISDRFGLQLSTEVPQAHRAQQLANRLSNAGVEGERVFTRIPVPVQAQDATNALHRVAIPGQPELNQMATHIDMQGHAITAINSLDAQSMSVDQLWAEVAYGETLYVDGLEAESIQTETLSTTLLFSEEGVFDTLFADDAHFAHLAVHDFLGPLHEVSVGTLLGDVLSADLLDVHALSVSGQLHGEKAQFFEIVADHWTALDAYIDSVYVNSAQFESIETQSLTADSASFDVLYASEAHVSGTLVSQEIIANLVYAADVVTPYGSLGDALQRLNDFESLWTACVQSGGCQ